MAALQKDTPIANRCGLNLRICDANNLENIYQTIDFANISKIELNGGTTFATGGQARGKQVGFYDKLVGEFTMQTQILTQNLMVLMTGGDAVWDGQSPIVFKNRLFDRSRVFAIVGETVWRDRRGNVYGEQLVFHRVKPRIAYKRSFSKDGEVASVDIVFDLMQDDAGQIITRGEPKVLVVAGTLLTSLGYVTEEGMWVLGSSGSVTGQSLIMNG